MTYAERSYLYILRRAVRRNLRGCHRHSSPTYLPTALLPPLHSPVLSLLDRTHSCILSFSFSLSFLLSRSFHRFARFSHFFLCVFAFFFPFAVLHFGNIKSSFSCETDIDVFFCQRRFFQSSLDYSLTSVFTFWIHFIYLFFALFKLILN